MKIAAAVVPLLVAAPAFAQPATDLDEPPARTTSAETLVVVTPNPPVIVQTGGPGATAPTAIPATGAPAAMPAVAAPPQNEDWSNVSHINGQLVKVGERGDYLYNNGKHTNIAINPFGPLFGYWDGAIQHAVSQHLVISGQLAVWDFNYSGDHYNQGWQGTVSLPIYFRRAFSGPFLEPGVIVRASGDEQWAGPEVLFGWHWTFDSGLNISWAVGVARHVADNQMQYDGGGMDANGYFRVGYAF